MLCPPLLTVPSWPLGISAGHSRACRPLLLTSFLNSCRFTRNDQQVQGPRASQSITQSFGLCLVSCWRALAEAEVGTAALSLLWVSRLSSWARGSAALWLASGWRRQASCALSRVSRLPAPVGAASLPHAWSWCPRQEALAGRVLGSCAVCPLQVWSGWSHVFQCHAGWPERQSPARPWQGPRGQLRCARVSAGLFHPRAPGGVALTWGWPWAALSPAALGRGPGGLG